MLDIVLLFAVFLVGAILYDVLIQRHERQFGENSEPKSRLDENLDKFFDLDEEEWNK